jgi:HlyD family secretion protein
MSKKHWLIVIAAVGLVLTLSMVVAGARTRPPAQPVAAPAQVPYAHYLSGSGIIEANTKNIEIGTPLSGVVTRVFAVQGEHVNQGDLLFRLDDRDTQALLERQKTELVLAHRRVDEAQADLVDKQTLYNMASKVEDTGAISKEEVERRKNAMKLSDAKLATARADVVHVNAQINETRTTLERLNIRAPLAGEVLQINIRVGEYALAGENATPLMILGGIAPLHVRVDIDESDSWRFVPQEPAMAFLRGNPSIHIPLQFAYIEPYVLPKRALTGDSSERVDTRVLQVVYSFDPDHYPVYVGLQVDVYIATPYPVTVHDANKK